MKMRENESNGRAVEGRASISRAKNSDNIGEEISSLIGSLVRFSSSFFFFLWLLV